LGQLRTAVLEMGGLVEEQIGQAVRALIQRDEALARATIERDHTVNRFDVEIDDLSLKLLALRQPAARDLRLITTALKITTDLERIGDMATHIAERAIELAGELPIKPYIDIPRMADVARDMLRRSLDAFVREDTEPALGVCRADDKIDQLHEPLRRERARGAGAPGGRAGHAGAGHRARSDPAASPDRRPGRARRRAHHHGLRRGVPGRARSAPRGLGAPGSQGSASRARAGHPRSDSRAGR